MEYSTLPRVGRTCPGVEECSRAGEGWSAPGNTGGAGRAGLPGSDYGVLLLTGECPSPSDPSGVGA